MRAEFVRCENPEGQRHLSRWPVMMDEKQSQSTQRTWYGAAPFSTGSRNVRMVRFSPAWVH